MLDEIFKQRNLRNYEKAFELYQDIKDPKPLEALFEFSIINYYLPFPKKMLFPEFFKSTILPILNCNNENFVNTMLANLKFYIEPLQVIAEYDFSKTFQAMARNKLDTFYHSNPCIFYLKEKDCYGLNVRCVNYSILPNGVYKMLDDKLVTLNKMLYLDKNTFSEILPETSLSIKVNDTDSETRRIQGYEDVRIFSANGKTVGSYCIDNKIKIATGMLKDKEIEIDKFWNTDSPVEKNWVYLNEKYLIYSWYPNLILLSVESGEMKKFETSSILPSFFRYVKGSTCAFAVSESEYWIGLHFNSNTVPRIYYNLILVFDFSEETGLKIKKYSLPFKLEPSGNIEFYLGMIVEKEKDRIIFSASQNDNSAKIYVCNIHSLNFVDV